MRLLVIPAVVGVLLVGLWISAGKITNSYAGSIALSVAWLVVASAVTGKLVKRFAPSLRALARAATVGTSIVVAAWFYWTSIRETTVDERVVTGVPMSALAEEPAMASAGERPKNVVTHAGDVESRAHSGEGRARIVELAGGGRKLTLTDFDIDPGPQVVVRLVADDDDHVDLGDLKGSRGDQQYAVPDHVDLDRHRTVVFWCVPFSQSLAEAKLRAA